MKAVFLDTGVLSLVTDKPGKSTQITAAQNWLVTLLAPGTKIYVPEICDDELRHELTRVQKTSSVRRLNTLVTSAEYLPLTTPILPQAAQLWATAHNTGKQTASDTALDGDIILCAQVLNLALAPTDYLVATTNTKHLTPFITADESQNIKP